MSELVSLERDDRGVYTLMFRRPEVRNALNPQAFTELIEGRSLLEHLDHEAVIQAGVIGSADFREGLAAAREKRTPVFEGT